MKTLNRPENLNRKKIVKNKLYTWIQGIDFTSSRRESWLESNLKKIWGFQWTTSLTEGNVCYMGPAWNKGVIGPLSSPLIRHHLQSCVQDWVLLFKIRWRTFRKREPGEWKASCWCCMKTSEMNWGCFVLRSSKGLMRGLWHVPSGWFGGNGLVL